MHVDGWMDAVSVELLLGRDDMVNWSKHTCNLNEKGARISLAAAGAMLLSSLSRPFFLDDAQDSTRAPCANQQRVTTVCV